MNIILGKLGYKEAVSYFSYSWIIISISTCIYFSFIAFPAVLIIGAVEKIPLYIEASSGVGDSPKTTYIPNRPIFKSKVGNRKLLEDFLIISRCDLLTARSSIVCDRSNNWLRIPISEFGCKKLETCDLAYLKPTQSKRTEMLGSIKTIDDQVIPDEEFPSFKLDRPSSWGPLAPFLMFLLTLFLSLKAGRLLGSFLFEPYGKHQDEQLSETK